MLEYHHTYSNSTGTSSTSNSTSTSTNQSLFEAAIAHSLFSQRNRWDHDGEYSSLIEYPLRRKLCRLARQAFVASLVLDGERIGLDTKAWRYTEVMCFLLNETMLLDICALRTTCMSNSDQIRRFPVVFPPSRELEANLIEGFVAYDACRFVSTAAIKLAIGLHGQRYRRYIQPQGYSNFS